MLIVIVQLCNAQRSACSLQRNDHMLNCNFVSLLSVTFKSLIHLSNSSSKDEVSQENLKTETRQMPPNQKRWLEEVNLTSRTVLQNKMKTLQKKWKQVLSQVKDSSIKYKQSIDQTPSHLKLFSCGSLLSVSDSITKKLPDLSCKQAESAVCDCRNKVRCFLICIQLYIIQVPQTRQNKGV